MWQEMMKSSAPFTSPDIYIQAPPRHKCQLPTKTRGGTAEEELPHSQTAFPDGLKANFTMLA
jgi:hypothetical protein